MGKDRTPNNQVIADTEVSENFTVLVHLPSPFRPMTVSISALSQPILALKYPITRVISLLNVSLRPCAVGGRKLLLPRLLHRWLEHIPA